MTRETKIGLLVGLAFIVVFAVLLSHNTKPPGESLNNIIASNVPVNPSVTKVPGEDDITQPRSTLSIANVTPTPAQPDASVVPPPAQLVNAQVGAGHDSGLPNPKAFEPTPGTSLADANNPRDSYNPRDSRDSGPTEITGIGISPRMPTIVPEPQPTVRPVRPDEGMLVSNPPTPVNPVNDPTNVMIRPVSMSTTEINPKNDVVAVSNKEYQVQKGDSLYRIAEEQYKSRDAKYIEMIVKANGLKDANTISQGQKLVIPNAPADTGSARTMNTQVADSLRKPQDKTLDEIAKGLKKSAPVKSPADKDEVIPAGTKSGGPGKINLGGLTPVSTDSSDPSKSSMVKDVTVKDVTTKEKETSTKNTPVKETSSKSTTTAGRGESKVGSSSASKESAANKAKSTKDSKDAGKGSKDGKDNSKDSTKDSSKDNNKDGNDKPKSKPNEPVRQLVENKGDELGQWEEVKPKEGIVKVDNKNSSSNGHWQETTNKKPNSNVTHSSSDSKPKTNGTTAPNKKPTSTTTKPVSSSRASLGGGGHASV